MSDERLFLDTGFVQAWFNRRDQYHGAARALAGRWTQCKELWTTDAILLEVGAVFRGLDQRSIAAALWNQCRGDPRCNVVQVSGALLDRAMELFGQRPDKCWSLTDCTSFIVMQDHQLTLALSCDRHFLQAGFRALLLEEGDS